MHIYEMFNQLSDQLLNYQKEFAQMNDQLASIGRQYNQELEAAKQQVQSEVNNLNAYKPKIKALMNIASAHCSRLVRANRQYTIDLNRLSRLSIQIDNSKRADPYAEALYTEASGQLLTIDYAIQNKQAQLNDTCQAIYRKYSGMETQIDDRRKQISAKVTALLRSGAAAAFVNALRENQELFLTGPVNRARQRELYGNQVCLGALVCNIPTPEGAGAVMEEVLGQFYNRQNSTIHLPFFFQIPGQITYYEYPANGEIDVLHGLQMLLINSMRYYEGFQNVVYIDPVRYNSSSLEGLAPLAEGKRSFIEKVPGSAKEVEDLLDRCLMQLSNPSPQQALSGKILIFHCFPWGYSSQAVEKIRQLCANAGNFNLSIVLTHQLDPNHSSRNDAAQNVKGMAANKILYDDKGFYTFVSNNAFSILWYSGSGSVPGELLEQYANRQQTEMSNEYSKRIGFPQQISYRKGIRYLDKIPLAVNPDGEIISIDLENSNFATFLCGASRSGKSTLLHTLITGVLRNLHPDDVEVWLIDFKMIEFNRYIDHMPPHVRYVVLDKSPELVYDIIDRLTDILQKRQNIFKSKGNFQKLSQVPPEMYMPAMLIIIDEFSFMSQIVADSVNSSSENYKAKLQALLALGSGLGMHFIFASQGFTTGTSGLTDFSKQQIQRRIAMKTEYLEIKETLDLKSTSDEDQAMMEQLPVHHALLRVPVDERGNHLMLTKVLYISDYAQQEKMIHQIRQSVVPAKRYDVSDPTVYIDKQTMIIDGNVYHSWMERSREIRKRLEQYSANFGEGLLLFPGEPRRMVPTFPIEIADSYCENILAVAPVKEKMAAASMVLSIMESAKLQNYETVFWASRKNNVFQQIRMGCGKQNVPAFMDLESICDQIRELKNRIRNGYQGNTLYLLMGFESLMLDMSFQGRDAPDTDQVAEYGALSTDLDGNKLYYHHRADDQPDLLTQMQMLLAAEDEEPMPTAVFENADKPAAPVNEDADARVYDARKDLVYILEHGPRLGYHFLMVFNTAAEVDQNKIETKLFKHKLLFLDSKQNAMQVVDAKTAETIPHLESHSYRYSNGIDACSYRPYLHRGLTWDGWTLDDQGTVVCVEEEEEVYLL